MSGSLWVCRNFMRLLPSSTVLSTRGATVQILISSTSCAALAGMLFP